MENPHITQPSQSTPDIWGAVILMKDGSYAVIIFLILIVFMFRKAATQFFKEHLDVMRSLRDSNIKNSDTLEKTTKAVERISKNNTVLTTILAKYLDLNLTQIQDDDV